MSDYLKKKDGTIWGKKTEVVEDTTHITQCNENADDSDARYGVHITDNIRGTKGKTGTYFDGKGEYLGIKEGKR